MAIKILATHNEIKEIKKNYPTLEFITRCQDCVVKKPMTIGRMTVWRCPYSTVDVDLDGYCHRGVKMSEDRAN